MKIKLDESIPHQLVDILQSMGHEVDTVKQEGLKGHDDLLVWDKAREHGRLLITQDLDFSDIRRFAPGTHPGLLLVRLRSPGRQALVDRLQHIFQTESVETWEGCFAVITEHKFRIRYPSP